MFAQITSHEINVCLLAPQLVRIPQSVEESAVMIVAFLLIIKLTASKSASTLSKSNLQLPAIKFVRFRVQVVNTSLTIPQYSKGFAQVIVVLIISISL